MTSPSLGSSYGGYGGGYYATPSFADTPIYDSLVAERGTPQIAPIRVPAAYDTGNHLPALQSALPALAGPGAGASSYAAPRGYQAPAPQPAPLQQAPAPYFPQQAGPDRGGYQAPQQYQYQQQPMRPVAPRPAAPRPAAPRPAVPRQMPGVYEDPYGRQHPAPGY